MADVAPWLSIIGLGEDGPEGISVASREALSRAELVMGSARHLSLLPALTCPTVEWPVPFEDGIELLLRHRGKRVAMLASGDPFHFGAGSSVTRHLSRQEWSAYPAPSTFTLAASRLGWALQDVDCLGLHAAPLQRLRPYLRAGRCALVLLRGGAAVGDLAQYLAGQGFGDSILHVMEALAGPRERVRSAPASSFDLADVGHPVVVGIEMAGQDSSLPTTCGMPDDLFASDGQMTKRPVRALTLSALAPRPGELLWDIGSGSGSIAIEWLLAHPANLAIGLEPDAGRAARARTNALELGVDRLIVVEGRAPACLPDGPHPDAVFIGGGMSDALLEALCGRLPAGTRLVANAVTLETEALLACWHGAKGGQLMRIELADAAPLGSRRGWKARYPVVQWSVTL